MDNTRPIGIFDSGMGGLTVAGAIQRLMPSENIVYVGDMARLPYGVKTVDTVRRYSLQLVNFLLKHKIKMLVVACNTATISSLDYIRKILPNMIVLGVIEPGAKRAVMETTNNTIAVLATGTTVSTGAYRDAIQNLQPKATVHSTACNLLVSLAEEGWHDKAVAKAVINEYVSDALLQECDTVILGCTHFPIFSSLIEACWNNPVTIVNSAAATANEAYYALAQNALLNTRSCDGTAKYFVTDSAERFAQNGARFLGKAINGPIATIDLHVSAEELIAEY